MDSNCDATIAKGNTSLSSDDGAPDMLVMMNAMGQSNNINSLVDFSV